MMINIEENISMEDMDVVTIYDFVWSCDISVLISVLLRGSNITVSAIVVPLRPHLLLQHEVWLDLVEAPCVRRSVRNSCA